MANPEMQEADRFEPELYRSREEQYLHDLIERRDELTTRQKETQAELNRLVMEIGKLARNWD